MALKKEITPKKASIIAPPPLEEGPSEEKIMGELQDKSKLQESELKHLKHLLEVLVNGEGCNVREAKILELFKKNRCLKLAFEHEKNGNNKLRTQLTVLQQQLLKAKKREEELKSGNANIAEKSVKSAEAAQWREKFYQAKQRLSEVQSARTCLEINVTKLREALQREVGDIPLSQVLEEGGEWRGRSQTISLLKDKVKELKALLQRSSVSDEIQRTRIEAFQAAKQEEFDKLATDFLALREELRIQKMKLDTMSSRRDSLQAEIQTAKEKMAMLVNKSETDDRLITALRLEVESYRQITGPIQLGERVGGPIQLAMLEKEHQLAAAFTELKTQCYQQELEIQAQAELITYLRSVAAKPFEEEEKEKAGSVARTDEELVIAT